MNALVIDAEDIDTVQRLDARMPDIPLAEQPPDRNFSDAELHVIFLATQQLANQLGALMLRPNPDRRLSLIAGHARTAANVCRRRLMRAGYRDPKDQLTLTPP